MVGYWFCLQKDDNGPIIIHFHGQDVCFNIRFASGCLEDNVAMVQSKGYLPSLDIVKVQVARHVRQFLWNGCSAPFKNCLHLCQLFTMFIQIYLLIIYTQYNMIYCERGNIGLRGITTFGQMRVGEEMRKTENFLESHLSWILKYFKAF